MFLKDLVLINGNNPAKQLHLMKLNIYSSML